MVFWRSWIIHIRDDEVGGNLVGTRILSEVLLLTSMSHVQIQAQVVNQHLLHQDHHKAEDKRKLYRV